MSKEKFWQQMSSSTTERGEEYLGKRSAEHDAAFLLPYLKSGLRLLDCGCAEGSITLGLADAVKPGQVTGIDVRGDSIAKARTAATNRGISNVGFQEANVYQLPFEDASFDVVYANALFQWVSDPAKAAREMCRVLKQGGVLAARSSDAMTKIWWPDDEWVQRFWSVFHKWRTSVGADDFGGRKLPGILQGSGLSIIETSVSSEPRGRPGAFRWYGNFWANMIREPNDFSNRIIDQGFASKADLEEMANALIKTSGQPQAFIAVFAIEVLARKPE